MPTDDDVNAASRFVVVAQPIRDWETRPRPTSEPLEQRDLSADQGLKANGVARPPGRAMSMTPISIP